MTEHPKSVQKNPFFFQARPAGSGTAYHDARRAAPGRPIHSSCRLPPLHSFRLDSAAAGINSPHQGREKNMSAKIFVRGDIDGFFGLFIDNLLQLMLINLLCRVVCGFPDELVTGRILPGAAVSIMAGNFFYFWQARRLAKMTGRDDVTALPYGINTPSLIAYILLIMGPVYRETGDWRLAWQAGLFACFLSGVIECAGAFCGDWLRRNTPRAALLSALSGIAITFISMGFIYQIFASPAIALLPMLLILITYASRIRLPFGLPGGLVAVLVGTGLAWGLHYCGRGDFSPSSEPYRFMLHRPETSLADVFALFSGPAGLKYLAVIFPMGLFNVIGSLQNLESAEAAGDRFETCPSLFTNGLGSLIASFLGSPFPTTIYIGHPAWKAMGARSGYSAMNGVIITALCLVGGITLVQKVVPIEATIGILLWIGIIITAQSFQEIPKAHCLAVAFGLIPSLAAWDLLVVENTVRAVDAAKNLQQVAPAFGSSLYIHGMISLSQGFMLTAMIFSAMLVFIIERRFMRAAWWALAASAFSMTGLIHAYSLTSSGVANSFGWSEAPQFAAMYAAAGLTLMVLHLLQSKSAATAPRQA